MREIDIIRRWINGGALENAGSKAAQPNRRRSSPPNATPGKRPDVIPMPPRMVLEPAFQCRATADGSFACDESVGAAGGRR